MITTITFQEITDFVSRKYKQAIVLEKNNDSSITASYIIKKFLPSVKIITLNVESVSKESVKLKYESKLAPIINATIKFVESNIPDGVEIDSCNNTITVHLQQIKELKKALEFIYLRDIAIKSDRLVIETAFV